MRFGISSIYFSGLIPTDLTMEQLPDYVTNFDPAVGVRELAALGFNPIELSGDLVLFFPHVFAPAAIERLVALQAEQGLSYTVHLPLWSTETSTLIEPVRQGAVRAILEVIKATLPLRPEAYVLHATGALASEFYRKRLPEPGSSFVLRQFQRQARKSLEAILAEAGIPSRQLAIETVEFPFELMLELAEELDLSVCFDTGHVLVGYTGPVDLFDALERCLPRVAQVHLHDGASQGPERQVRYGKDHQPLGAGDLDVARLLDRLAVARFTGPLIFELRLDQALASLDVIRAIRPAAVDGRHYSTLNHESLR